MSKRTAEASKAVKIAWEQEKERILQGKGTRDWTEEQQRDILDPAKGKAYDENGHAFQGQHMKSVEAYPNFQGNPDNIQFLTEEEHFYGAHKGSWNNPTNCYYDPVSKEFVEFETDELIPCAVIELSNPIITLVGVDDGGARDKSEHPNNGLEKATIEEHIETGKDVPVSVNRNPKGEQKTANRKTPFFKRLGEGVIDFCKPVVDEIIEHPIKSIFGFSGAILTAIGVKRVVSSGGPNAVKSSSDRSNELTSNMSKQEQIINPDKETLSQDVTEKEESIERDYPDGRSSPKKHDVSAYDRKQNGKMVHVNRYVRGKDKGEEETSWNN